MAEEAAAVPGRLLIVCGLPGSGKTTTAVDLATRHRGVRLSADEWMDALGIDLWDTDRRARVESLQWELAQDLLGRGVVVVVEWGSWSRSERDALRDRARAIGAAVELHFLDAPPSELHRRVSDRGREDPPITRADLEAWSALIERPDEAELALFDEPEQPAGPSGAVRRSGS